MRAETEQAARAFMLELATERDGLVALAAQRQEMIESLQGFVGHKNGGSRSTNGNGRPHGEFVRSIAEFLARKGRLGAHVNEISKAVGRDYNNVYVTCVQSRRFVKTGKARFALRHSAGTRTRER